MFVRRNVIWLGLLVLVFLLGGLIGSQVFPRIESLTTTQSVTVTQPTTLTQYVTNTITKTEKEMVFQTIQTTYEKTSTASVTIIVTTTMMKTTTASLTITKKAYPWESETILVSDSGSGDKDTRPFTLNETKDLKIIITIYPTADLKYVGLIWYLVPAGLEKYQAVRKGSINEESGEKEFYLAAIPPGNYYVSIISANCRWEVKVVTAATTTITATPQTQQCHPSYPDVCIPPPPPNLDCKDIPYRNFKVLPPDPHNFDTDGDGIGCET